MKFPLPGCTGRRVLVISQGAVGFWAQAVNLKGLDDYDNLVGGLEHFFYFSILLGTIIPTDELHHFSEGLKPPTSNEYAHYVERQGSMVCGSPQKSLQALVAQGSAATFQLVSCHGRHGG